MDKVVLLNPHTCGIYKDGGPRYKVNPATGERTEEIDNEMAEQVSAFLAGKSVPGLIRVPLKDALLDRVLVPRYYDRRWDQPFEKLCKDNGWTSVGMSL